MIPTARVLGCWLFAMFLTMITHREQADCPAPKTLAEMKDCYRPLILFSPSVEDPRTTQQLKILNRKDLLERDVLVILVPETPGVGAMIPDLPSAVVSGEERERLRARFKVAQGSFAVILIGKDGGEKARRPQPLTSAELNRTIDAMPMRKLEAARPGTFRKPTP